MTRFGYGWCEFCPEYTYHDLWRGACGECRWRWGHFPETMPLSVASFRAEMTFACSPWHCEGTSCPRNGRA
jgi:hypothetical protein